MLSVSRAFLPSNRAHTHTHKTRYIHRHYLFINHGHNQIIVIAYVRIEWRGLA